MRLTCTVLVAFTTALIMAPSVQAAPVPPPWNHDLSSSQWFLSAVHAPQAWLVTRGAGVTVAVVDTGVDSSHPDLAGRVTPTTIIAYTSSMRMVPSSSSLDLDGHGTHVAGIIAGNADGTGITGVAPEAMILPVKITQGDFREKGFNKEQRIADALRLAHAEGATVVNMSFGGPADSPSDLSEDALCKAIASVSDLDLVIVTASGNDGDGINPMIIPSGCPGVLSVGAVDSALYPAYFSTFNSHVTLTAPGVDILSTQPAMQDWYAPMSGTSMAAPIVSGVAALVRSAHPSWNARQVTEKLISTARDIYAPGVDPLTGHGLVDAALAVDAPSPGLLTTASLGLFSDRQVVHWRTPILAVESYLLEVYNPSDPTTPASSQVLPAGDVSWDVSDVKEGSWVTLTARLVNGGSIIETVLPAGPDMSNQESAPPVTGLKVHKVKHGIRVSWVTPPGTLALAVMARTGSEVTAAEEFSLESGRGIPQTVFLAAGSDAYSDLEIGVFTGNHSAGVGETTLMLPAKKPVYWTYMADNGTMQVSAGISDYWFQRAVTRNNRVRVKITHAGVSRVRLVKALSGLQGHTLEFKAPAGAKVRVLGVPDKGVRLVSPTLHVPSDL